GAPAGGAQAAEASNALDGVLLVRRLDGGRHDRVVVLKLQGHARTAPVETHRAYDLPRQVVASDDVLDHDVPAVRLDLRPREEQDHARTEDTETHHGELIGGLEDAAGRAELAAEGEAEHDRERHHDRGEQEAEPPHFARPDDHALIWSRGGHGIESATPRRYPDHSRHA